MGTHVFSFDHTRRSTLPTLLLCPCQPQHATSAHSVDRMGFLNRMPASLTIFVLLCALSPAASRMLERTPTRTNKLLGVRSTSAMLSVTSQTREADGEPTMGGHLRGKGEPATVQPFSSGGCKLRRAPPSHSFEGQAHMQTDMLMSMAASIGTTV